MYHVRDRNVRYYAFTCYVTKACRTPLDRLTDKQTNERTTVCLRPRHNEILFSEATASCCSIECSTLV